MKKEILIHTISFILLFVLISLFKGWISISYWQFWMGGVIGTILPDVDHLIYVYWLKPYELTSQRVTYMTGKGEILRSWELLASTRSERVGLIFHSFIFQILFVLLAFLTITSSGSLLGRGLVLAFLLHLAVDQLVDYLSTKNLNNWTAKLNLMLDNTQTLIYLFASFAVVLIFGALL